jgi:hypothetical protein
MAGAGGDISALLKSGRHSDVVFVIQDGSGGSGGQPEELAAHSQILAARSEVFDRYRK